MTAPLNPGRDAASGAKHTPGPWAIVEYGDGDSLAIHDGDSANRICFMATHGGSQKQWASIQANATLIAAAPDLLASICPEILTLAAEACERNGSPEMLEVAAELRGQAKVQTAAVAKTESCTP